MNANVQAVPAAAAQRVSLNQMMVSGRIEAVDEYEDSYYSIVITPAPDAFSQPSTLKIKSRRKIGKAGEDVMQLVQWNGWLKRGEKGAQFLNGFFIAVE